MCRDLSLRACALRRGRGRGVGRNFERTWEDLAHGVRRHVPASASEEHNQLRHVRHNLPVLLRHRRGERDVPAGNQQREEHRQAGVLQAKRLGLRRRGQRRGAARQAAWERP